MLENHPFNKRETIPGSTSVLIVGTAPPPRFASLATDDNRKSLDFDFFYGSEDNDMWIILEEIAKEKEGAELFQDSFTSDQCCMVARSFLERHGLWMHDVLSVYERKVGRTTSAADTDIVAPKSNNFSDFRAIITSCPSLKMIVFTSQQAAHWAFDAMHIQELIKGTSSASVLTAWRKPSEDGNRYAKPLLTDLVGGNSIHFFVLPSPSMRSPESYENKLQAYRTVLFEIPKSI